MRDKAESFHLVMNGMFLLAIKMLITNTMLAKFVLSIDIKGTHKYENSRMH